MDIQKAIKLLEQEYERAQKMCFVRNPLAWALYRVWKKADGQKDWDEDCIRDCKNCWKTKLANSQWIPVTERLPELIPCNAGTAYSEAGIVCTSGKKIMVAVWDGIDFLCDMDYWEAWGEAITHWMPTDWLLPLPEPPKEVSDES